ncbi:MAG TPA: DNA polymerase I [Acidimicrobiia bacterium]|jgi:DNA polymerase-1|nr:DNA polymerase I [Acidimicrobiia bacterium]
MPTLALLDGHSLAYRAFFALPPDLATQSGQMTNSVYGFTRMLLKLVGDHHPDGIAIAWDVGRDTFRLAEYSEYKANRSSAPDQFRSQLPLIREVMDALGYSQLQAEGYEADDVIATVANRAIEQGWDVLVVTGDRDSFQLVGDHLKVLYTRRGISDTVLADAEYVEDRYGIRPDQYLDYASLRGDTSDNLPGVPGVGEKTASRLIAEYGDLEGIYQHLDDHSPRLKSNLEEHRDQVFLNQRLMRLVDDLDLRVSPTELVRAPWDRRVAKDLFESLEFHSIFNELDALWSDQPTGAETLEVDVSRVTDPGDVARLAESTPLVLVPVWEGDELAGLAVPEDAAARYVPVTSAGPLLEAIGDATRERVAHDAKDLLRHLVEKGLAVDGPLFDTALAAYVVQPATRTYDLGELSLRYLGLQLGPADQADGGGGAQGMLDFSEGPDIDDAGRRAVVTARLAGKLRAELEERGELELYAEIEAPLVAVLARMEAAGIGVDRAYLEELGESLRDQLATLERGIHQAAGEPFNVNSTKELRHVLYTTLGLPALKKTSTGVPSTDASVLAKLADAHPMVELLLRYRELEKLRSTYVDGYLPLIGPDERIHTRFNQMAATTGRLSSDRPNLQNIPVRSETGRTIRRAFVAREGWRFLVADYSQIELRVLAHMSGDPGLVEAFESDADIHTATAARVFGLAPENVMPEMRRRAKVINFGLLYGMEAFGLADRLEISRDEAREHIDAYFAQFPDVRDFMRGTVTEARNRGYTTTLFGRRRYLPELQSDNFRVRQMGERMALNAPVQGTAADIIKKAMIELDRQLAEEGMRTTLLLQIHDELVVETPSYEEAKAGELMVEVMEGVTKLGVPLRADLAVGATLADTKA